MTPLTARLAELRALAEAVAADYGVHALGTSSSNGRVLSLARAVPELLDALEAKSALVATITQDLLDVATDRERLEAENVRLAAVVAGRAGGK
jgi:hypothetical protein